MSSPGGPYRFEENHRPWFVWTLILAPCLMPIVWNYHVRLSSDTISFGYSCDCAERTIDLANVRTAEVVEHINGLCEWGGYGIRWQLPTFEVGYIARNGPGVRLTFMEKGKEKAATFSCFDPEKLVTLLTG